MDSNVKDELDSMFEKVESRDVTVYQKTKELQTKFQEIIAPIFSEFQQYYIEKNMTATMADEHTLNVTRGNSSFYIKCEFSRGHIRLAYMIYGGGLEKGRELNPENITKESVTDFLKQFTEYILKY